MTLQEFWREHKHDVYKHTKRKPMVSRIVNGRSYTDGDKRMFTDLTKDQQEKLDAWIDRNICPQKTPNNYRTSYGIKHYAERNLGFYISNNQFKDAMLLYGYKPVNETELNWHFRISEKSRAFKGVM